MLHFAPEQQTAFYYIQNYSPGCLTVNHQEIHHSLIIFRDKMIPWSINTFEEMTLESLKPLFDYSADVILLGTGERQFFLPHTLSQEIEKYGRSIDLMSSQMAALTYNLLAQESRNPLLALIIS